MGLFRNKIIAKLPDGFTADDIKVETSICTGEKTIGFFSRETNRLMHAELVKSQKDIELFYEKYGLEVPEGKK